MEVPPDLLSLSSQTAFPQPARLSRLGATLTNPPPRPPFPAEAAALAPGRTYVNNPRPRPGPSCRSHRPGWAQAGSRARSNAACCRGEGVAPGPPPPRLSQLAKVPFRLRRRLRPSRVGQLCALLPLQEAPCSPAHREAREAPPATGYASHGGKTQRPTRNRWAL